MAQCPKKDLPGTVLHVSNPKPIPHHKYTSKKQYLNTTTKVHASGMLGNMIAVMLGKNHVRFHFGSGVPAESFLRAIMELNKSAGSWLVHGARCGMLRLLSLIVC